MNTQLFKFKDTELTLILDDKNEPWFAANEVCKALGLLNAKDSVASLPEEGKKPGKVQTAGGLQTVVLIDEANLYQLVFRSNKPEARKFTSWVTKEVLPAIRKTGAYKTPEYLAQENKILVTKIKRLDALARDNLSDDTSFRHCMFAERINYSQDEKYVIEDLHKEALVPTLFWGLNTYYGLVQVAEQELQNDFPDYDIPKLLPRLGYVRLGKELINGTKQYLWEKKPTKTIVEREKTSRYWPHPQTGELTTHLGGKL
jgi:prophage antirepressor-like protein